MGVCCPPQDQGPQSMQDLPAPSLEGLDDIYRKYELTTLFARTPFGPFEEAVQECAGENDYVTFESLAAKLDTPMWRKLTDPASAIRKLLEQPMF